MKTVWSKINTYGSFLHFESFKAIQAWYQMRNIVNIIKENNLPEFTSRAKNTINCYVKKIQVDYSKWTPIETEFRMELDSLTDNWKRNSLRNYSELVQEQFDANTVEEGKRLIYNMISEERREQDAQWMSLVREYKDSWLSKCAIEKVGNKIRGLGFKKINEAECTKIFEDIWKEVDDDKKEFYRQMVYQSEELKQHVQVTFNNAVNEFSSTVRQDSKQKEKEKFKRDFWTSIKKPSTLEENININIQQIQCIIEVKPNIMSFGFLMKNSKKKIAKDIYDKLTRTINGITFDLKHKTSLHIEYGQAIKWFETLCNCLFDFTQQTSNMEFKTDFDFIEVIK